MKNKLHLSLALAVASALSVISWPVAVAVAFASFVTPVLGASYPAINATTKANLTDQDAKIEEELWSRKVVLGAEAMYGENPFADGFMGEGDGGKAIVKITDTEKIAGNTINITTYGGFGGPGSQGSADRIGNEQKIQASVFQVKIGRQWFGVGFQSIARDETMIGGRLDSMIVDGLRQLHAQKRNDDMIRLMIEKADATARNNAFTAAGPSTVATIKTAHYVDTPTITTVRNKLSGIGALPMALGPKDSGGSRTEKYMFFGTHHGLSHLDYESAYLQAQSYAGVRGTENPIFKGNYSEWSGIGLYRWFQKDHGNAGPIGSLLSPRTYLAANLPTLTFGSGSTWANRSGVAFTNTTATARYYDATGTATTATGVAIGGGYGINAAALSPYPEFTRYFSNAPWTYHNGNTIAAGSTARYVMIIGQSGANNGKYGIFQYAANSGRNILLTNGISTGLPGETTDGQFLAGDLVVECNVLGVPVGRSIAFGREAIICGVGSINGSRVSPQMGRRTEEHRNHDLDHAIGAEAVWGAALIERSDGVCPGFVVVNSAIPIDGAPVVT